ncbi:MAG: YSC84-related protein [Candidatus Competibacteraceae bacterium]|jgi:lipid-binding SYLF domain-containing protein
MKPTFFTPLFALCVLLIAGCATPQGETASEQRASVQQMAQDTLAEAYRLNPGLQNRVKRAAGYGVFSNRSSKILLMSSGNGYGLVRDNRTGGDTYMRMAEIGGGLGMGIKDFRAVFVFQDGQTLRQFVDSGWDFGGDVGAAAKTRTQGGQVSAGASAQGIEIYQFTDRGLDLAATVAGTKYWQDKELNAGRSR